MNTNWRESLLDEHTNCDYNKAIVYTLIQPNKYFEVLLHKIALRWKKEPSAPL